MLNLEDFQQFTFFFCDKHNGQREFQEEEVYFLILQVYPWGKSEQGLYQDRDTETETETEAIWLELFSSLLCAAVQQAFFHSQGTLCPATRWYCL